MKKKYTGLTIRVDKELHDKFQYVAEYNGRSMSMQTLQLIMGCVRAFEREHGPISKEDMEMK